MNVAAFAKRHRLAGDRGPIDVEVSLDGIAIYAATPDGRMSFSDFGKVAEVAARFQSDIAHYASAMQPEEKR